MALTFEQKSRLEEILSETPEQRYKDYGVIDKDNKHIEYITIDGNIIKNYTSYTYFDAKSYAVAPSRSTGGVMGNINDVSTFLTPRLKLSFALMDIDTYRTIMKLIQQKNEYVVTCYDPVWNERVTHKMYFATEDYPELFIYNLDLLAAINYSIELIGTNNDIDNIKITYDYNLPNDAKLNGIVWDTTTNPVIKEVETPKNVSVVAGEDATFKFTINEVENIFLLSDIGNSELCPILTDENGNKYKFETWQSIVGSNTFNYVDSNQYIFHNNITLKANFVGV